MMTLKEQFDVDLNILKKAIVKTTEEEMAKFAKSTGSHVTSISIETISHYKLNSSNTFNPDSTILSDINIKTTMDD